MEDLMEKIVSLSKRRGFVFQSSEIYGGLSNSWDYGPLGVEFKNNIKQLWWKRFVQSRDDVVGIDAAIIMNPNVWEASGHLSAGFSDELVECKNCHHRFKKDFLEKNQCPSCDGELTEPRKFNLMFKTFVGPAEGEANIAYFRPETAQAMFVNFKNILDTARKALPFGIAQIGKAFRNEITPGNFIFRTREFEQMEIEYFIPKPKSDKEWVGHFNDWQEEIMKWAAEVGIDAKKIHEIDVPESERAHYSKKTIDFEYEFPFGKKELYGLAYRADFDLKNHEEHSGHNLKYKNLETGEEFWPHVIEPSFGVDRTMLAVLLDAYKEDENRVVLKLKPKLAPYKAAIFPLLANKPELVKLAKKIYDDLRKDMIVAWDHRGNIGKRYYSQDEIGTPYCVTVDFDSQKSEDVTLRDRDTMKQERVKIKDLIGILNEKLR